MPRRPAPGAREPELVSAGLPSVASGGLMGLAMGLLTRTRKLYAVLLPTLAHAAAGAVLLPFTCGGWGTGWLPIMLGGYSAVLLGCPVLVVRARFTGRAAA